ncbi:hypothetical protein [Aquirhabdus sp.]|uniref:hypothetical protein n=1 Tax=Aquirhabdus sp. TaxID=2824160 RepID=UPI00396CA76D
MMNKDLEEILLGLNWDDFYQQALEHFKRHWALHVAESSLLYAWLIEQCLRNDFSDEEQKKLLAINFFEFKHAIKTKKYLAKIAQDWTTSEDQFLIENCELAIDQLAQVLQRSTDEIQDRRQSLGLIRRMRAVTRLMMP